MQIKVKLMALLLAVLTTSLLTPLTSAAATPPEVDSLVNGFPSLDELERHLGLASPAGEPDSAPPPRADRNRASTEGTVYPVSARWFTAAPPPDFFNAATTAKFGSGDKPIASLFADMDAAQKEAIDLEKQIKRQNNLPINRYLLDRWTLSARTQYGDDVTGLFVGGIGIGTFQQTFLQSYGIDYTLPLLQRYAHSTKWERILNGWTVGTSAGVMPQLGQALQLQQLLHNLQLTWSVSLSYDISGSTLRKLQDHQYDQEQAFGKAAARASVTREELLKTMVLRIDALSANRPASDTRVRSLRELYPQFELYQARYDGTTSCDERMEDFFTLKGLALSLLTLAGYDRPDSAGTNLLQTWKRARFAACGRT